MPLIQKNSRAFSMVEVIIAAIILTTTIALVFGTIAKTRQPLAQSNKKLRAAIYGQQVLDTLRAKVSSQEWANTTGVLTGTKNLNSVISPLPDGVTGGTYTVTDMGTFRKVVATITYDDSI